MGRKLQLDSAIAADIQTVNADSYIDSLKMIDIENIEPNRNNFYENSEIEALADDEGNKQLAEYGSGGFRTQRQV